MHREAGRIWQSVKDLFYYNRVGPALAKELPNAGLRLGVYVFLAAGLVSAILTIAITAFSMHMAAFEYSMISEVSDIGEAEVQWGGLLPVALFQFLFLVPFGLVFSLVYEGVVYKAMRLSGGKGTFAQQYYLSSLVALSMAISSVLGLFGPVPCLRLPAALALLLLVLYFVFFVNVRAYQVVHDVSFLHPFAIVLLLAIPRLLVVMFIVNAAAPFFSLPEFISYSGV